MLKSNLLFLILFVGCGINAQYVEVYCGELSYQFDLHESTTIADIKDNVGKVRSDLNKWKLCVHGLKIRASYQRECCFHSIENSANVKNYMKQVDCNAFCIGLE